MDIKVFKLINGDEVVGKEVDTLDANVYCVEKPRILQVVPTREGPQAALVPWLIANQDIRVEIPKVNLLIKPVSPTLDVEKHYLEITSGISLASSL